MEYIIKKGDTLSAISKKLNIPIKKLVEQNNIADPNKIYAGSKLKYNETKKTTPKPQIIGKILPNNTDKQYINFNLPKFKSSPSPNKEEYKTPSKAKILLEDAKTAVSLLKKKVENFLPSGMDASIKINLKKSEDNGKNISTPISNKNMGFKKLDVIKDDPMKSAKDDSLFKFRNFYFNEDGTDFIVSPKLKEGHRDYDNVEGVAHFIMDGDITPNQKYTSPYKSKNQTIKSNVPGKFLNFTPKNPNDWVHYYKPTKEGKYNFKVDQLKNKENYPGYSSDLALRYVNYADLNFDKTKSTGYLKNSHYLGKGDKGEYTSIITNPANFNDYGRFSGGSVILQFKDPKTGKIINGDISGSVNDIKKEADMIMKEYGINKKDINILYHDMGSYSAKPVSKNGKLSTKQWESFNYNNKGYSGAALIIPKKENGGKIDSNTTSDILLKINEFKNSVPEYIYNGYINSGLDGLYKGMDKTKYDVVQRTLPDGTITYLPYTYSNVHDNSKNFNELQDRTYNKQIAVNKYNLGGGVSPYQVIQPSIYPQNYGINSPYFSQQPPLFDGQVGSPYYSTFDNYNQYGIRNNPISRDLMQRTPLAKSSTPTTTQSIGSEVAGMGGNGGGIPGIDPISAGITMAANVASATFDATNMLMQNLSKEDSATRGWADASIRATKYADAVTDIVKDVPVVGPVARAAGKQLSFWIAGPAGARSANIRKKETKHTTDLNEFNERNSQTVLAPNNYGNYMAEFGINTETKNNPLMEEILNDFRNYLAQIQNT